MSRIKKRGLDYFPLNTDFMHDRLVRRIMKREGDGSFAILLGAHAGLGVQNRLHTACTGQSRAHLNDEVGQLDQFDQDLVHIVDQRDDVAGGHAADHHAGLTEGNTAVHAA